MNKSNFFGGQAFLANQSNLTSTYKALN